MSNDERAASDELVQDIVTKEWAFFQGVNNRGGRASCQDSPRTFAVMRQSQFEVWSDEMLKSYLDDLREAEAQGRNPLAEKYAYMMKSTHPLEFAEIASQVPPVSPEKLALVEKIVAIQLEWAQEMARRYPAFTSFGRPVGTSDDAMGGTSIETYARGELCTYSMRTLELALAHYEAALGEGRNLQEESDEAQVRLLGFESLAAAEEHAARMAERMSASPLTRLS